MLKLISEMARLLPSTADIRMDLRWGEPFLFPTGLMPDGKCHTQDLQSMQAVYRGRDTTVVCSS